MYGEEADYDYDRGYSDQATNDKKSERDWGSGPLSGTDKRELMIKKLGFEPMLFCNVAGVVAGGKDRQDTLRRAAAFVTAGKTLTQLNDGIRLYHDKNNIYDSEAVQVWLGTSKVGDKFVGHEMAGFIPKRWCPHCGKSFGGKNSDALQCPMCLGPLNMQPVSWLNRFICQNYLDQGINIWYSVWWINQANPKVSWGCQLGIQFPKVKLTPPR